MHYYKVIFLQALYIHLKKEKPNRSASQHGRSPLYVVIRVPGTFSIALINFRPSGKHAHLDSSGMDIMGVINPFLIGFEACSIR